MSEAKVIKIYHHMFHTVLLVATVSYCVYQYCHPPKSGEALLVLAGVAALMMLADMHPFYKGIYVVVVIALILIENGAIKRERIEAANAEAYRQEEENTKFQAILRENQKQFEATMRGFGENVNTITGGNSFAVVWAPLIPLSTPNTFSLVLQVRGHYDLQDVRVDVVKLPEPGFGTAEWAVRSLSGQNTNVTSANLGNVGHMSGMAIPFSVSASDDGGITEYSVNVYARNRMTHESLRIRKNLETNRWESSIKIFDGDTHKTLEQSKPEWRGFALLPPK